jgi:hypothetical protein
MGGGKDGEVGGVDDEVGRTGEVRRELLDDRVGLVC